MALLETLTLTLAPAVAKAILKLWLPEKSLALNFSDGVIEALKKYGVDFIAARSVDRLFRELASEMADRLSSTVETEFPSLPESDREAAALTVANLFEGIDVPEALVRSNINALEFEKLIQPTAVQPFRRLGGDAES